MKQRLVYFIVAVFLLTMVAAPAWAGSGHNSVISISNLNGNICHLENVDLELRKGTLTITPEDSRQPIVEITEDYELYVDDERVELNSRQQQLVENYYNDVSELKERVGRMVKEGLKLGARGGLLGLKAVAGVFRMILPAYDSDDLERDLERDAKKLEEAGEELEEQAERLEDLANDLEETAGQMNQDIPELAEVDLF